MFVDDLSALATGSPMALATMVLALLSIGATLFVAASLGRVHRAPARSERAPHKDQSPPTFLFDDRTLIDATPAGHRMLKSADGTREDWASLLRLLQDRFSGLVAGEAAPDPGTYLGASDDDDARLLVERWGTMMRLTVLSDSDERHAVHPETLHAMEDEIETLRGISENAPVLIWQEDSRGAITWANRGYLQLADRLNPGVEGDVRCWPPARLFSQLPDPGPGDSSSTARIAIDIPASRTRHWYEVTSRRRGAGTLNFASDVGAIVAAETQNRQFMQTITKTFAQLSIGLAIFDRDRKLVIFNPALLDLTDLPVSFLSSQPSIRSFLDRLRDRNMIPEPANYHTWREQMVALEVAAERGSYRESWALPTGQTYRVTGRPHPDGAIALTFEDATAEISLARNFRSELEIAQGVLDTLDEAIAVFSPAGTLWMSNSAYTACWGHSAEGLEDIGFREAIDIWQARSAPAPIWSDARHFAGQLRDRAALCGHVRHRDGRAMTCRVVPLPGGVTMVGFTPEMDARADGAHVGEDVRVGSGADTLVGLAIKSA